MAVETPLSPSLTFMSPAYPAALLAFVAAVPMLSKSAYSSDICHLPVETPSLPNRVHPP
ncbi:hypothetical protein HMPREF0043_00932 [Actinobaculum sp. oral taxon 183 str. F0552]|nr:hypothetical protein HMPREF0043_00932 [Actinobaculum sp. oral taxon 183 str. F0552]